VVSQEQRRRQLAREKFLRQQQRRTEARRKSRVRNAVIASVLGVTLIGSLALYTTGVLKQDDDKTNAAAEVTPEAEQPSKAPDPCEKPAAGEAGKQTWKKEPALSIDKSATYTM
jgi:peptidyl-prolyl cis-trans isomerase B (cyclophilin B)